MSRTPKLVPPRAPAALGERAFHADERGNDRDDFPAADVLPLAGEHAHAADGEHGEKRGIGLRRGGAALQRGEKKGRARGIRRGDWLASTIAAGVALGDNYFGNANDTKIAEPIADAIFAKIAAITIRGFAAGTVGIPGDHFGFVAEQIGKLIIGAFPTTVGGPTIKLTAGLALGTTGDLRVREV